VRAGCGEKLPENFEDQRHFVWMFVGRALVGYDRG
jgi:hypothetical protein